MLKGEPSHARGWCHTRWLPPGINSQWDSWKNSQTPSSDGGHLTTTARVADAICWSPVASSQAEAADPKQRQQTSVQLPKVHGKKALLNLPPSDASQPPPLATRPKSATSTEVRKEGMEVDPDTAETSTTTLGTCLMMPSQPEGERSVCMCVRPPAPAPKEGQNVKANATSTQAVRAIVRDVLQGRGVIQDWKHSLGPDYWVDSVSPPPPPLACTRTVNSPPISSGGRPSGIMACRSWSLSSRTAKVAGGDSSDRTSILWAQAAGGLLGVWARLVLGSPTDGGWAEASDRRAAPTWRRLSLGSC